MINNTNILENHSYYSLTLCPLGNFLCYFVVCWFQIWVQTVNKGYQEMTLGGKELITPQFNALKRFYFQCLDLKKILHYGTLMEIYYIWSFSSFRWFKKGWCQLQAKVLARSTGQACPGKSVVRLTDRPDMTIAVDRDVKQQTTLPHSTSVNKFFFLWHEAIFFYKCLHTVSVMHLGLIKKIVCFRYENFR